MSSRELCICVFALKVRYGFGRRESGAMGQARGGQTQYQSAIHSGRRGSDTRFDVLTPITCTRLVCRTSILSIECDARHRDEISLHEHASTKCDDLGGVPRPLLWEGRYVCFVDAVTGAEDLLLARTTWGNCEARQELDIRHNQKSCLASSASQQKTSILRWNSECTQQLRQGTRCYVTDAVRPLRFSSVMLFATCCWWRLGVYGLLSNKCVTRLFGCLFTYLHCSWMCLYAWVFFQRNIIRKKCIPKWQQLDLDEAQLASYNQTCTHARIWDDRWRGMIARFILDTNVHLPRLCILHDLCRFVLDWCFVVVKRCISLWLRTLTICLNLKTQQQSRKSWYVNHDCQFFTSAI